MRTSNIVETISIEGNEHLYVARTRSKTQPKQINIVQLGKYYPPQYFGGIEKMTELSARALADDYNLTVICHSTSRKSHEEVGPKYRVIRCGTQFRAFSQPISLSMGFQLRKTKPDLIHLHGPNFWGAFVMALFCPKVPVIVTHHNDVEGRRFLKKLLLPLYRWTLKRARLVIVTSLKNVKRSTDLPPDLPRVVAIPPGVDERDYELDPFTLRQVHNQKRADFGENAVIGFVGRLVWYKGLSLLLQAISRLPHVSLVLIGDGPLLGHLQEEARSLDISERVRFAGAVSTVEKIKYLHMIDMLALPSTHVTEAFGITQLEALICSRPVISTDLPTGVSDVNVDGKTGLVVPVKDVDSMMWAINRLAMDRKLRERLGAAGRERVQAAFSEHNYMQKLQAEVAATVALLPAGARVVAGSSEYQTS
jgi:glycosyltransferase involved in cell wall biosynthesis